VNQPVAERFAQAPRYRCGDVEVDARRRILLRCGEEVPLETKAFAVVLVLLARAGALVTREQLLDEVWGHRYVTPSTLNRVIALARRAFGDDAQAPRFIDTVHGTGYRYSGPIERMAWADEGVASFAPPLIARLPARVEPILGREADLAALASLLEGTRALTILGPGGVGKTQCALECARRLATTFPDGVWFFDLVEVPDAARWTGALAEALGVRATDPLRTLARIIGALAGRRALLLLDNCDRIAPELGQIVHALLVGADGLRVLATSQRALHFVGEHVFRLAPLELPVLPPAPAPADVPALAAVPAVSLLLARIRSVQSAFRATEENIGTLAEICIRLDGVPLALELAAARFALLSPSQVLERLDQRFRFLSSDAAGRDPRHRNLQALLEWSYGLLSGPERRLLSWLGVFVRGWSVDAAIAFAAELGHDAGQAVELLGGLADKSLVSVDAALVPPRYRLLESVRDFALARLHEGAEVDLARDAHVVAMRAVTANAHRDMLNGQMAERIATLAADTGNVEAAVEHAVVREPQSALEIVGAMHFYLKGRGAVVALLPLCSRAVAGAPRAPTRARARALLAFGVTALPFADLHADEALDEAIAIACATGDEWVEAYARAHRAMLLADRGDAPGAGAAVAAVAAAALPLGDPVLDGLVALARGWALLAEGRTAAAIATMEPARRTGADLHQHHFIEMYLGLAQFRLGDLRAAAHHWREAASIAIPLGHVRGAAGAMEGCAYLEVAHGRMEEAAILLGAAEAIRTRTIPLYRWWLRHHDDAMAAVVATLGAEEAQRRLEEGARMREEDAINSAVATLVRHALGAPASGATR
jgi:non-specific serine/threonine protein kinase